MTIKTLLSILPLTGLAMFSSFGYAQQGPRPIASEVFHLRAECAALGDKLVARLIQERKDQGLHLDYHIEGVSHYSAAVHACYVKTTGYFINRDGLYDQTNYNNYTVTLYDGQTREQMAILIFSPKDNFTRSFLDKVALSGDRWFWNRMANMKYYDVMCPSSRTERDDCHFFELTREFIERKMNDSIQMNR